MTYLEDIHYQKIRVMVLKMTAATGKGCRHPQYTKLLHKTITIHQLSGDILMPNDNVKIDNMPHLFNLLILRLMGFILDLSMGMGMVNIIILHIHRTRIRVITLLDPLVNILGILTFRIHTCLLEDHIVTLSPNNNGLTIIVSMLMLLVKPALVEEKISTLNMSTSLTQVV
jgi:hypothetical protein